MEASESKWKSSGIPHTLLISSQHANSASYNMSLDHLLFESVTGGGGYLWRLYAWEPYAVSIGRNQKVREAVNMSALRTLGLQMVRRPTGGRAIFHKGDICLTCCGGTRSSSDRAMAFKDDYMMVAGVLVRFLRRLGLDAAVSHGRPPLSGSTGMKSPCFQSAGKYEITVRGQKIAGIAQYRSEGKFLIQGSIRVNAMPAECRELLFPPGSDGDGAFTSMCSTVSSIDELSEKVNSWENLVSAFGGSLGLDGNGALDPSTVIDTAELSRLETSMYANTGWNERI
jgi:lipoate-protein ligase A